MHVRFTSSRGMTVMAESSGERLGVLTGVFVHPDRGMVEGFFVRTTGGFFNEEFFLAAVDIVHWGTAIRVRFGDVLSPLQDRIRLYDIWQEGRRVLGQKILLESGRNLGRCGDVQFDTATFTLEWIFPRRLFGWGRAVPASAIVEVKPEGIVVRETLVIESVTDATGILPALETLKAPLSSRTSDR